MRRPGFGGPTSVALLIALGAHPSYGQSPRLPSGFTPVGVRERTPRFTSLTDSVSPKRTYWLEGGLIGAAGGVLLASVVNGLACEGSCGGDQRTLVMLVGGFVVGGLIGGGIEKKS